MLAIVIPYFRLAYFQETIASLSLQTNKRFKVYIGDDASPDDPTPLIEKYKHGIDISLKRFKANLGQTNLVKHWERCIDLIEDERWICLLGDDDILAPNTIAEFYSHLDTIDQKGYRVVRTASQLIDAQSKPISDVYHHPKKEKATDSYYKKFSCRSRSSLSEYFFDVKMYNSIGFTEYPLAWCTDDKAWLDFSKNHFIYTLNNTTIKIRRSGQNISSREDNLALKEQAKLKFYKDVTVSNNYGFKNAQKSKIMMEFVHLLKKHTPLNKVDLFAVIMEYIKMGELYNAVRLFKLLTVSK